MEQILIRTFFAVGLFTASLLAEAAEAQPLRKIRVAITSISGTMAPPWAAHEAGIFKKYGLQVEVIATPSGIQGTNALIAGEVAFLQDRRRNNYRRRGGRCRPENCRNNGGNACAESGCPSGDRKGRAAAR